MPTRGRYETLKTDVITRHLVIQQVHAQSPIVIITLLTVGKTSTDYLSQRNTKKKNEFHFRRQTYKNIFKKKGFVFFIYAFSDLITI